MYCSVTIMSTSKMFVEMGINLWKFSRFNAKKYKHLCDIISTPKPVLLNCLRFWCPVPNRRPKLLVFNFHFVLVMNTKNKSFVISNRPYIGCHEFSTG